MLAHGVSISDRAGAGLGQHCVDATVSVRPSANEIKSEFRAKNSEFFKNSEFWWRASPFGEVFAPPSWPRLVLRYALRKHPKVLAASIEELDIKHMRYSVKEEMTIPASSLREWTIKPVHSHCTC